MAYYMALLKTLTLVKQLSAADVDKILESMREYEDQASSFLNRQHPETGFHTTGW